MISIATRLSLSERAPQFIKFCLVGLSGTVVDMALLYVLADPGSLGLNVTLSKVCAAEVALVNNFVWNEVWTFRVGERGTAGPRGPVSQGTRQQAVLRRLFLFHCICGAGIGFAIFLLHLFHTCLGWNLYLSNALAIGVVTAWNFGLNATLNWRDQRLS